MDEVRWGPERERERKERERDRKRDREEEKVMEVKEMKDTWLSRNIGKE